MDTKKHYPVVETFYSLQGEGSLSGTPTVFLRLGGCNVGRNNKSLHEAFPLLTSPEFARGGVCASFDGSRFYCDTPYNDTMKKTLEETVQGVLSSFGLEFLLPNVCFTGGEPVMHDLTPLVQALKPYMGHSAIFTVETSGTKPIPPSFIEACQGKLNIVCSPKDGYLKANTPFINEFRFLVNNHLPVEGTHMVIQNFLHYKAAVPAIAYPTWVSPVAEYNDDFHAAASVATKLCLEYPALYRLSLQTHKVLRIR